MALNYEFACEGSEPDSNGEPHSPPPEGMEADAESNQGPGDDDSSPTGDADGSSMVMDGAR